ncbi:glycosyltransferase family 39 protein [Desulfosarcina sp. OttesenSCG-928-G10]|nr:glycosyltransferase family 39 protein [Desulfosarcina sp. OttesenSCG-928-G10]MDL2321200.1 glycosyltransferase family 39 protein [Desulfosarcina sp. OttesenSCG-928-B08]
MIKTTNNRYRIFKYRLSRTSAKNDITTEKAVGWFILLLGVIFRLLLISDHYLSLDDLFTVTITAQTSFADAWTKKIVVEPHPPLFNVVVYFWTRLFSDSVCSLRSLSALFYFIVLCFIYRDGRHILPQNAFILYFALTAFTPVSLRFFLEVRPYTFYYPASMLAMLYFIALVKQNDEYNRTDALKFVCWALIAALSHYFGMALVFFQVFYLFLLLFMRKKLFFKKRNIFLTFPVIASLVWFAFHISQIKNNQIATTWIYPTGLKYCIGYLQLVFGAPLPRIATSNDPQSISTILQSPLELVNVIAVCIPLLAVCLILIFKGKQLVVTSFVQENEEKKALLASIYLAVVPFLVFFVIGKFIPIVNWKYMMGYTPAVWMFLALLLGTAASLRPLSHFFLGTVLVSSFLYFPGLVAIPRTQIGDALQEAVVLSEELKVPLVLPDLIEYKYFIDDNVEDAIHWHDIDKSYENLPHRFISVFGHCTPTTNLNNPSACVGANKPVLRRYGVEKVWKFALAGIYQFERKQEE